MTPPSLTQMDNTDENGSHMVEWITWDMDNYDSVISVNRIYRQTSDIRGTLVGSDIVDHSDVVGASPVGAAPTTSSFST